MQYYLEKLYGLRKGHTNSGPHFVRATKFGTVALEICGPQYGTCFISIFWRIQFWGVSQIFGKILHPWF